MVIESSIAGDTAGTGSIDGAWRSATEFPILSEAVILRMAGAGNRDDLLE